jgi:hypothetical protein
VDIFEQFSAARDMIFETLRESLPIYFSILFDPMCEALIERETCKIAFETVQECFPDLPEQYIPQFRIKRSADDPESMEIMVQQYFCRSCGLRYIGTAGLDNELFDVYIRDPSVIDGVSILVKYGHDPKDVLTGTERAYHEHSMGMYTPLSVAYQMAMDEGLI